MTHVTDGVTDDIVWMQGMSVPLFNIRLGHLKKENSIQLIYVLHIIYIYYIYGIYLICILYIFYSTYICSVKSVYYINRPSFTTYIW